MGRSTSVAFLTRAYHAFLARHHRDDQGESLAAAVFVTEDRVNTCHACGPWLDKSTGMMHVLSKQA
jgi:hypothetical protein